MKLLSILGNAQRLDGGAMFGNCPRAVWERWCAPDDRHRIDLACRALLVRDPRGRTILLETGIGAFFEPSLRERYGVLVADHLLLAALAAEGIAPEDVDVVVLSHLHFDHAGGLLRAWQAGEAARLAFDRASYVVGRRAWDRAQAPHLRDRASFIPELCGLLEASGRVELVDGPRSDTLGDGFSFTYSDGHTPGLTLTRVATSRAPITFMGDLIPGVPWVHLPITMGYDRFPELLIDEKHAVLDRLIDEEGWAFFTHDPTCAAARVCKDDAGRYRAQETVAELRW